MHVPGNSYTRRNPALKGDGAPYGYEVVEDDERMVTQVKARVEFNHVDGEPRVWLTGGSLTADQALRLCEVITGMIEMPPADWQPGAMPAPTAMQREALRRIGQATRKSKAPLDDDLLGMLERSALAQAEMRSDGSLEWTPDRDGMPGHTSYVISPSGVIGQETIA